MITFAYTISENWRMRHSTRNNLDSFYSFEPDNNYSASFVLPYFQVSVALMELGFEPKCHDNLIELVASSESGFSDLFSQQQFEVSLN